MGASVPSGHPSRVTGTLDSPVPLTQVALEGEFRFVWHGAHVRVTECRKKREHVSEKAAVMTLDSKEIVKRILKVIKTPRNWSKNPS